jgi:hypothetical protein
MLKWNEKRAAGSADDALSLCGNVSSAPVRTANALFEGRSPLF